MKTNIFFTNRKCRISVKTIITGNSSDSETAIDSSNEEEDRRSNSPKPVKKAKNKLTIKKKNRNLPKKKSQPVKEFTASQIAQLLMNAVDGGS